MKILSRLLPTTLLAPLFIPLFAFAQAGELTEVSGFIKNFILFMNTTLVPFIFAVAFLVFLWGMFKYFILGGHDTEKQDEGKDLMLYAIIGFVVMVSMWGIVNLLSSGFGLEGQRLDAIPDLPYANNPRDGNQ